MDAWAPDVLQHPATSACALTLCQASWFHRGHMPPTQKGVRPIHIEIPEPVYQALLKGVAKGSKVSPRLGAAEYGARKGKAFYTFAGSRAEVLLLRALALSHAKAIVPAIDKALKAADTGGESA